MVLDEYHLFIGDLMSQYDKQIDITEKVLLRRFKGTAVRTIASIFVWAAAFGQGDAYAGMGLSSIERGGNARQAICRLLEKAGVTISDFHKKESNLEGSFYVFLNALMSEVDYGDETVNKFLRTLNDSGNAYEAQKAIGGQVKKNKKK